MVSVYSRFFQLSQALLQVIARASVTPNPSKSADDSNWDIDSVQQRSPDFVQSVKRDYAIERRTFL